MSDIDSNVDSRLSCPKCRFLEARDAAYCPQCGSSLDAPRRERAKAPWRDLRLGQSTADIQAALGAADSVEINAALNQLHWFYGPYKMSGARVEFDGRTGRVTFWREPE